MELMLTVTHMVVGGCLGAKVELETAELGELELATPRDLPAQGEERMVEEVIPQEEKASDGKGGSGKHISIFKTYISPWERALGLTPQEKSQFTIDLLSYDAKAKLCPYKSFNRTAMPYGGYEKALKLMTFQMPEFDAGPLVPEPVIVYNQEVTNRPSFNRTPVPWQGSGEPGEYSIEVNVPMAGETEEL
ncbi:hypothetical protein lerEdw1_013334 [Lerista edwardsae]|nr:hypothetical protein lerEdw1_013334 [Lerista edwardsae]